MAKPATDETNSQSAASTHRTGYMGSEAPSVANQSDGSKLPISRGMVIGLTAYQIAWLVAWVWVLFSHRYAIYHLYVSGGTWQVPLWIAEAGAMGSLGGVAFSIHGLRSGNLKMSASLDTWLWHLVKPLSGALLGAVCGLLSYVLLSVSGSSGLKQHLVIAAVGFVCGMYEHLALQLLKSFADNKLTPKR